MPQGHIETLLKEIKTALLIGCADDTPQLRLDIYGAQMVSCGNDFQTYIAYVCIRRDKLAFLKSAVADADLVAIFLRGLHIAFQPIQLHFAIPGNQPRTLELALDIVRRFAATSHDGGTGEAEDHRSLPKHVSCGTRR